MGVQRFVCIQQRKVILLLVTTKKAIQRNERNFYLHLAVVFSFIKNSPSFNLWRLGLHDQNNICKVLTLNIIIIIFTRQYY